MKLTTTITVPQWAEKAGKPIEPPTKKGLGPVTYPIYLERVRSWQETMVRRGHCLPLAPAGEMYGEGR